MAWFCPWCKRPDAVAHVENAAGLHPFPCLFCDCSTVAGPVLGVREASRVCATPRCGGLVTETFGYDVHGRLAEVRRRGCPECGSALSAAECGG
ncbi:hypothetical protein [Streptomyces clavuligerus]|uniref:Uncharacterized protein n=1 Tax=Streptomyces clavuligerus TaxID=1901 RepID=E2PYS6_STRCL|nr:hypothetical protein [Streptomyces clavuligerus]ANW21914.1 hypothetical protein BB341_12665 [Streptomyces clavuligerus]AXU16544.1 hypothetical protein D1794_13130 [Streptomyces clavuligerus]EFG08257.1 Hypothetical protein SCLAV_3186 [Streptomyces clavuligerus]MBY6303567.1 hypothetical protein [Streptomyces clavuligerus]QCS09307.1 hypothetical protein CRV15_12565 [Streptomyces clavuligerus]